MSLDQQGYLWMSDPWVLALTICAAVATIVWCHRLLASERGGQPVPVPAERVSPPTGPEIVLAEPGLHASPAGRRRRHGHHPRAA